MVAPHPELPRILLRDQVSDETSIQHHILVSSGCTGPGGDNQPKGEIGREICQGSLLRQHST